MNARKNQEKQISKTCAFLHTLTTAITSLTTTLTSLQFSSQSQIDQPKKQSHQSTTFPLKQLVRYAKRDKSRKTKDNKFSLGCSATNLEKQVFRWKIEKTQIANSPRPLWKARCIKVQKDLKSSQALQGQSWVNNEDEQIVNEYSITITNYTTRIRSLVLGITLWRYCWTNQSISNEVDDHLPVKNSEEKQKMGLVKAEEFLRIKRIKLRQLPLSQHPPHLSPFIRVRLAKKIEKVTKCSQILREQVINS